MGQLELRNIEKQAAALSLDDLIKRMKVLAKQLKIKRLTSKSGHDWSTLYGAGKGLWDDEDAQDYVNKLREDR
jgi:hypothetical protein